MKAILLAAGKGERLGEVTKHTPKPMIKIKNKPILEHDIEWLKSYKVKEIYINLHHLPDLIKNYFKDGRRWGLKIFYSYEPEILGTAGAIKRVVNKFKLQEDRFLVIYGDNFFPIDYNLEDFIKFHIKKRALVTVGLFRKKSEISKSGIVILDRNNKVIKFSEKPLLNKQNLKIRKEGLINAGLYLIEQKIVKYIPKEEFSDFGKDIFPKLLRKKIPVYGYVFKKSVIAIDTIKLYEKYLKL